LKSKDILTLKELSCFNFKYFFSEYSAQTGLYDQLVLATQISVKICVPMHFTVWYYTTHTM